MPHWRSSHAAHPSEEMPQPKRSHLGSTGRDEEASNSVCKQNSLTLGDDQQRSVRSHLFETPESPGVPSLGSEASGRSSCVVNYNRVPRLLTAPTFPYRQAQAPRARLREARAYIHFPGGPA